MTVVEVHLKDGTGYNDVVTDSEIPLEFDDNRTYFGRKVYGDQRSVSFRVTGAKTIPPHFSRHFKGREI